MGISGKLMISQSPLTTKPAATTVGAKPADVFSVYSSRSCNPSKHVGNPCSCYRSANSAGSWISASGNRGRKFPLQQRVGMQEEAHRLRIMSFPNLSIYGC